MCSIAKHSYLKIEIVYAKLNDLLLNDFQLNKWLGASVLNLMKLCGWIPSRTSKGLVKFSKFGWLKSVSIWA